MASATANLVHPNAHSSANFAEAILAQRRSWHEATNAVSTNRFGDFVLTSFPRYTPMSPVVVISVNKKIMKDHDDIGNPLLIEFLTDYISFCDDSAGGGG